MSIEIRIAEPHEADTLTEIAIQAKSYWDYTPEQIKSWRIFLTFTPEYVVENQVWVAILDEQIIGVVAVEHTDDEIVLEHLWVSPDVIGKGVGRKLFTHVTEHEPEFVLTSDPNADAFYIKMGAVKIGEVESTMQGRMLTKFHYSKASSD